MEKRNENNEGIRLQANGNRNRRNGNKGGSGRGIGGWFPVLLLVIMVGAAAAAGISAAGESARKRSYRETAQAKKESEAAGDKQDGVSGDAEGDASTGAAGAGQGIIGVLRAVDDEKKTITVYQIARMEEQELAYTGATEVLTKYGNGITMRQLSPGLLIRTEYDEKKEQLTRVQEDDTSWTYKGVANLVISSPELVMMISDQRYQYDSNLTVVSQGTLTTLGEVSEKDVLTVRGIEGKIYSLEVTRGHGTLAFANYDEFVGGSIEVGYEIFDQIHDGMEYTLREGSYKLLLRNKEREVNKYLTIRRGETMLVDLNEYRDEVGRTGIVSFQLNPEEAELYLDNELIDSSLPVELGYGDYVLEVRCDGYESCSRLLSVSLPTLSIRIDLADTSTNTADGSLSDLEDDTIDDEDMDDDGDGIIEIEDPEPSGGNSDTGEDDSGSGSGSDSGSSSENGSGSNSGGTVIEGAYIMIRKPEGASVYFDGEYVGVAPLQLEKVTGEHQVRFERTGYISKSYTIEVESDRENPVFSFPDLTKE